MNKQESYELMSETIRHGSGEDPSYSEVIAWDQGYENGLESGYRMAMEAIGKATAELGVSYAQRDTSDYAALVLRSYSTA